VPVLLVTGAVFQGVDKEPSQRQLYQIAELGKAGGVASYNGDFVIHFSHPTWRDDRNDPATATRRRV
jgi:hypothetical protein